MGQRGPAPKPSALAALGPRSHHGKNRREPKFADGLPTCPHWMDREAKAEWKRILFELARVKGLIKPIDGAALAAYCQAWSDWRRAVEMIRKQGCTTKTKDGRRVSHPAVHQRNQALRLIKTFLCEFGMTPASRTRIQVGDGDGGGSVQGEDSYEAYRRSGPRTAGGAAAALRLAV